jgi:hypothetical protein
MDKAALGLVFSEYFGFPCHYSTNFSIIIITRGGHSRPIGGRSAEWTQLDSTSHYTNLKKYIIFDIMLHDYWNLFGVAVDKVREGKNTGKWEKKKNFAVLSIDKVYTWICDFWFKLKNVHITCDHVRSLFCCICFRIFFKFAYTRRRCFNIRSYSEA